MASTWGTSWGTSWLTSWDGIFVPPAAAPAPSVGGGRHHGYVIPHREFIIGDEKYVIGDEAEMLQAVSEAVDGPVKTRRVPKKAPAKRVNVEPSGELVPLAPINWESVAAIRQQSERLKQDAVIHALDEIVRRYRAAQQEEEDLEILLLD